MRRLLKIGGRSPADMLYIFLNTCSVCDYFRSRRISLLIRLLNAPVNSWQHVALLAHLGLGSPWLSSVWSDIKAVYPWMYLRIGQHSAGPCVISNGFWSDEGTWLSVQTYEFPVDLNGIRCRTEAPMDKNDPLENVARRHSRLFTASCETFFSS